MELEQTGSLPESSEIQTSTADYSDSEPDQGNLQGNTHSKRRSEVDWVSMGTSLSFREARISIAIDVSGSTYGKVIAAEQRAIRGIATLLPPNLQHQISVLPWSDVAGAPIAIGGINELDSWGDTDPNAIIQNPKCLQLLQESSFWFLMTDGEIQEPDVRIFARNLLKSNMHGKACVACVFGQTLRPPADCDITVGLSVFAICPHAAFLFTDVDSGKTYVLQTKGCFNSLLPPGCSNPTLDYGTKWEDLPRTSYENLSRVSVAGPQQVGQEEIILQDNFRINLDRLLKDGSPDEETVGRVLENEDNLKTVTLTAKICGSSASLHTWLDNVEEKMRNSKTQTEEAVCGRSQFLTDVMARIESSTDVDDLSTAEKKHREALARSLVVPQALQPFQVSDPGKGTISKLDRRVSSLSWARRVSDGPSRRATDNFGSFTAEEPPRQRRLSLATPGFQKSPENQNNYLGECMFCKKDNCVLVLLLRRPPIEMQTQFFPPPESNSKLLYPLTMGNYPETDIILSLVACEQCGRKQILQSKVAPPHVTVSAMLPVVSLSNNQAAWIETINVGTQKRFHRSDLLLVFLAILFTKLERILDVRELSSSQQIRGALTWIANMLLSEVVIQGPQYCSQDIFGAGVLQELLLRNFTDLVTGTTHNMFLKYPLDGFIVANAALSNSQYKSRFSANKRKSIIFLRFLYHLTERVYEYSTNNSLLLVEASKSSTLLFSDQVASRSLFKLDTLRSLSEQFNSIQDFQDALKRMRRNSGSYRLAISVSDLLETPFLHQDDITTFRRLGALFSWIESQASHSIAVFLHHLFRMKFESAGHLTPEVHFRKVREIQDISQMLNDPGDVSAKKVTQMIRNLPGI